MTIALVPPLDVERFRLLIRKKLGLDFDASKLEWLADVLRQRAHATHQSAQSYLAADSLDSDEIRQLAQHLTVTETFFFRSPDQLRALTEIAIEASRPPFAWGSLRVLSAGSASGEEAYSIAMLVRESHAVSGNSPIHLSIKGIDINTAMLERAASGLYSNWALRETPSVMRERWFRAESGKLRLDKSIRDMATFEARNLVDDDPTFWREDSFDVIFCRNVLMYFAPSVARAIVARFARSLRSGGLLFLGHAENLRGLSHDFHLHHTHGTFYYERKGSDASAAKSPEDEVEQRFNASFDERGSRPTNENWVETIRRATNRVEMLGGRADSESNPALVVAAKATAANGVTAVAQRFDLNDAVQHLAREQFTEARALLDALPPEAHHDTDVLLLRAVLLTHGGNLAEATTLCEEILRQGEMNAGAHYVLALCREAAGDLTDAMSHDRLASHLDPYFAMPRLHLGRLMRRQGDRLEARVHFEHALALLEREDTFRLLLFGGGFQRETLYALCRSELLACGGAP